MPAKGGKVDDDKEDNNNKHNDNKDNNNGAENMPAIGELKSGWREDEVPAKGGEVNDDGVDAAVLLLLAQILNPGEAVQGGLKGGSMFKQIVKQRKKIHITIDFTHAYLEQLFKWGAKVERRGRRSPSMPAGSGS